MRQEIKKKIDALKKLEKNKVDNIQKMITFSFERLTELDKYYYQWYRDAEERGFTESAEVKYQKWVQINEAIEIKEVMKSRPGII